MESKKIYHRNQVVGQLVVENERFTCELVVSSIKQNVQRALQGETVEKIDLGFVCFFASDPKNSGKLELRFIDPAQPKISNVGLILVPQNNNKIFGNEFIKAFMPSFKIDNKKDLQRDPTRWRKRPKP